MNIEDFEKNYQYYVDLRCRKMIFYKSLDIDKLMLEVEKVIEFNGLDYENFICKVFVFWREKQYVTDKQKSKLIDFLTSHKHPNFEE